MLPSYDTILGIIKGIGRRIAAASLASRSASCGSTSSNTSENGNVSRSNSNRISVSDHVKVRELMAKAYNKQTFASQSRSAVNLEHLCSSHEVLARPAKAPSLPEPDFQSRPCGTPPVHQESQGNSKVDEIPELPQKMPVTAKRVRSAEFSRKPSIARPLRQCHEGGRDEERRFSTSSSLGDSARCLSPAPEFKIVVSPPE